MKFPLLLFCSLCVLVHGEEPTPPAQKFQMWFLTLPPAFFKEEHRENSTSAPGGNLKMKRIPNEDGATLDDQFDVREILADFGAKFDVGEEAIYQPSAQTLMVRARPETVRQIQQTLLVNCGVPINIQVEAALVECSSEKVGELKGELSYETLRKAAGDSWRVLNQVSISTHSGQRATATSTLAPAEKKPSTADKPLSAEPPATISENAPGARLEIEPVPGPDQRFIDLNLHYQYFGRNPAGSNVDTTASLTVIDGLPTVLQVGSSPTEADCPLPGKLDVLIIRVDVIYPHKVLLKASMQPSP